MVCSPKCAFDHASTLREKKDAAEARLKRSEHKAEKEAARPLKWYEDRAQKAINHWIVHVRDRDENCISCGTNNPRVFYAAGHFRTRGAASQVRYNEDNLHKQCNFYCNSQLSGNIINYRPALIAKIGQKRYEALMNNNESHRYAIEELEAIWSKYTKLTRDAKK